MARWRAPLRFALALVILFEEWGWAPLARAMAAIGRLPLLRRIGPALQRLPPWAALLVFAVPALALLPVKLAALWAIREGHAALGLAVIVAAKLIGTAVVARLYALLQPTLMQLHWFARLHARYVAWKEPLLAWVRASGVFRAARAIRLAVKTRLRRLAR